jgi:hypothetical protein
VNGRRIPLQDAFDRLLLHYHPAVACEEINLAVRTNRLRLYCDGTLLSLIYICSDLRVVIEQEADGRWRCRVMPAGPGLGFDPNRPYRWEVDGEGADDLMQPPLPRPGRKSKDNWTTIVDNELVRLRRIGSPLLENPDELEAHLMAHVKQKTGHPPKYPRRLRQRIRASLGVQIKK